MAEKLEDKVSELERMMKNLAYAHMQTEMTLNNFIGEMKDFKDEMKDFKEEMKDFKDEMKDFKEEMRNEIKSMNKRWGELANKMGTVAEDIVNYLTKNRIYAMAMKDDTMDIINPQLKI